MPVVSRTVGNRRREFLPLYLWIPGQFQNQCRNYDMFSRNDMFVCLNRQIDELSFFFLSFLAVEVERLGKQIEKPCFLINLNLFSFVYIYNFYYRVAIGADRECPITRLDNHFVIVIPLCGL